VTLDAWLRTHEYLQPIARVRSRIDASLGALDGVARPEPPLWSGYAADFLAGVPLLQSAGTAIDLEPTERAIAALGERLGPSLAGGELAPGLLPYAGWIVRAAALRPLVAAFAEWRDDDRWMRPYCPTCGSPPAMAQLIGVEPGRRRFLVCGCCATRWRYTRTGCPFCEAQSHRLSSIGIDGEAGLRIDYCETCRGYLKTYDGQGSEDVLLADWTSLHLDVLARDRGLKRVAASLYELEPQTT
jgi:FdhE protein